MMKTSELAGAALDWAVAKCDGKTLHYFVDDWFKKEPWLLVNGEADQPLHSYTPSTNWSQAGPIIEREDISFRKYHRPDSEAHGKYYARICRESGTMVGWHKTTGHQQTGPAPLIAAMRCYVASRLGHEVEIPDELA